MAPINSPRPGTIGIWNRSEHLTSREVDRLVRACAWQVARHVCPAWGLRRIDVVRVTRPQRDLRIVQLVDGPMDADAWGYHDEDASGRQSGIVFVEELLDAGASKFRGDDSVSATLSHEVCELVVNGDLNRWADDGQGRLFWMEICDPVQDQPYDVRVRGRRTAVSNFVTPAWFDRENSPGASFDYLRALQAPFELSSGGWCFRAAEADVHAEFGQRVSAARAWRARRKVLAASRRLTRPERE